MTSSFNESMVLHDCQRAIFLYFSFFFLKKHSRCDMANLFTLSSLYVVLKVYFLSLCYVNVHITMNHQNKIHNISSFGIITR